MGDISLNEAVQFTSVLVLENFKKRIAGRHRKNLAKKVNRHSKNWTFLLSGNSPHDHASASTAGGQRRLELGSSKSLARSYLPSHGSDQCLCILVQVLAWWSKVLVLVVGNVVNTLKIRYLIKQMVKLQSNPSFLELRMIW